MISLKKILNEEASVFSISSTDPWEYKYDKQNTNSAWWTRKKGTDTWIDMKSKLSPEKYQQAVNALTKAVATKTTVKSAAAGSSVSTNNIAEQDILDSDEMDKVWKDVYNVFVNNPDKYFGQFSSWYNDQETKAADWVIEAFNTAWGTTLKKLEKSKSAYTVSNVKEIKRVVDFIANKLIRDGHSGSINPTYYYVNKGDTKWKTEVIKFRWDYM